MLLHRQGDDCAVYGGTVRRPPYNEKVASCCFTGKATIAPCTVGRSGDRPTTRESSHVVSQPRRRLRREQWDGQETAHNEKVASCCFTGKATIAPCTVGRSGDRPTTRESSHVVSQPRRRLRREQWDGQETAHNESEGVRSRDAGVRMHRPRRWQTPESWSKSLVLSCETAIAVYFDSRRRVPLLACPAVPWPV